MLPKPLPAPPIFSLKVSIQLEAGLILLIVRSNVFTAQSDTVASYTFCAEYDGGQEIIFIKCL